MPVSARFWDESVHEWDAKDWWYSRPNRLIAAVGSEESEALRVNPKAQLGSGGVFSARGAAAAESGGGEANSRKLSGLLGRRSAGWGAGALKGVNQRNWRLV